MVNTSCSLARVCARVVFCATVQILTLFIILTVMFLLMVQFIEGGVCGPVLLVFRGVQKCFSSGTSNAGAGGTFIPVGLNSSSRVRLLTSCFGSVTRSMRACIRGGSTLTDRGTGGRARLRITEQVRCKVVTERGGIIFTSYFSISTEVRSTERMNNSFCSYFTLPSNEVYTMINSISNGNITTTVFVTFTGALVRRGVARGTRPSETFRRVGERLYSSGPRKVFMATFTIVFSGGDSDFLCVGTNRGGPITIVGNGTRFLRYGPYVVLNIFSSTECIIGDTRFKGNSVVYLCASNIGRTAGTSGRFFNGSELISTYRGTRRATGNIYSKICSTLASFARGTRRFSSVAVITVGGDGGES